MVQDVIIKQDAVLFSEIFNVKWWPEVPNACHSQGEMGLKDIQYRGGLPINWDDKKIDALFSECCPKGLDTAMTSILDKGYSFVVTDNLRNVRYFKIEKQNENGESIEADNQRVFGRALNFADALKFGFQLFNKTLAAGNSFIYEDWFGTNRPYKAYMLGDLNADSRLDGLFNIATHKMTFRRGRESGYELEFSRDLRPTKVTICFNRFAVC